MFAGVLLFVVSGVLLNNAHATTDSQHTSRITEAKQKKLAKHPVWQHLLFAKHSRFFSKRTEVISDDFYLTKTQYFSPEKELIATLHLLKNDDSAFCRFPARFFWLSQQLDSLDLASLKKHHSSDKKRCKSLPLPNQDVSIIQVSGYLKNPASTFGHALVNIDAGVGNRLMNDSFNFGASVPPNDNSVVYAFKGLFGLYDAGFARADFFKNDAIYSKNEQRDMWEYVLDLNQNQKTLINYHLFELGNARFAYFFLKQNCGYRTGELLELITDISVTKKSTAWYAPDYIFHQMLAHKLPSGKPLVKRIRFLPSEQTQVYYTFENFSLGTQSLINHAIKNKTLQRVKKLPSQKQSNILDFLIQYANYKLASEDTKDLKNYKKEIVKARFALTANVNKLKATHVPEKITHIYGPKPSNIWFGLNKKGQYVGLALFNRDLLNSYTTLDAEFKMIDLMLEYHSNTIKLKKADFIKLLKIEDISKPLVGERKFSWEIKAGLQNDMISKNNENMYYVDVSAGVGRQLNKNIMMYALLGLEVNDSKSHVDALAKSAIVYKHNHQAVLLENRLRKRANHRLYASTKLLYKIAPSKNTDIRISLENHKGLGLSVSYFF